jgi:mono/diheme cytochrome c family protein
MLLLAPALGVAILLAVLSAGCSQGATGPTSTNQPPAATTPPSTPATTPASAPTTPAVTGIALGKMIFDTGAGNAGAIPTKLGFAKIKVNACKNCHGADGKGGKGLVAGPDIRGSKLQPDFDEAKFARAVTTGVDDTGKQLKSKMPRFSATPEETAALWLYVNSLK